MSLKTTVEDLRKLATPNVSLLIALNRIAVALEVLAGLKARVEASGDESEVMYNTDEDYARMQQEEFEKGRPVEED